MAKILVVDDTVDFAEFLNELLSREGHAPFVAHDGRKAIDHLESGEEYDLIITDMIMPELDGVGVLQYLKKSGNTSPVIMLSGGGVTLKPQDALKTVEHLVAATFTKPVDYQKLLEKIAELTE